MSQSADGPGSTRHTLHASMRECWKRFVFPMEKTEESRRQVQAGHSQPADVYRDAATALGVPAPSCSEKTEGTHAAPWTLSEASAPIPMGPDRFFDPAWPIDYLASFDFRSPNIALAALAEVNERATG